MRRTVVLFGQSEKGNRSDLLHIRSIDECCDVLGNPPNESIGVGVAIQTLMFQYEVLFYRVEEEGFSENDYFQGLALIEEYSKPPLLQALCMPGVGDGRVIGKALSVCAQQEMILMMHEIDLYDYLTHS